MKNISVNVSLPHIIENNGMYIPKFNIIDKKYMKIIDPLDIFIARYVYNWYTNKSEKIHKISFDGW